MERQESAELSLKSNRCAATVSCIIKIRLYYLNVNYVILITNYVIISISPIVRLQVLKNIRYHTDKHSVKHF